MRSSLLRGLLKNLKGEIPPRMRREFLPKDAAHRALVERSGKNFPIDAIEEWERWVKIEESRQSQLKKPQKNRSQHTSVEKIAFQAIAKEQPNGRLPDWFLRGAEPLRQKISSDLWTVEFYAWSERVLEEGEYWKQSGSVRFVGRIDPDTKAETIAISDDSSGQERIILFKVEVDFKEKTATIIQTTDLSLIDPTKLDIRTTGFPDSFDPELLYKE